MKSEKPRSSGVWKILAFFSGLSLLLFAGFACFYYFIARPVVSPAKGFAKALGNLTKQKVEVSGHTVKIEDADIMELALLQRKIQSLVRYKTTWLKSKNLMILRGDFIVKTGYDLSKSRSFTIKNGIVSGHWPEPKILSIELKDYEIYHSENGFINRLQQSDQQSAIKSLLRQARKDVLESGILEDTDSVLQQRISDLSQGDFQWKPRPD